MTSTATPTSTSSGAAATATANCGAILYDIPVQDASCAIPYGGNHTAVMSKCCQSADVVSYADNCGLYCLAEDQTVDDLTSCLFDNGASYSEVFCRGTGNATASETASDTLASGASVVASASGGSESTGSSTSGGSSSSSTGSSSAAAGRAPLGLGLTLSGVTVSAMLFSGFLFGALQL